MTIPEYQTLLLPIMNFFKDKEIHHLKEVTEAMSEYFRLTEEERHVLLPSETRTRINSKTCWAIHNLVRAVLLERTGRGYSKITKRGLEVLDKNPNRIDNEYLSQFSEFIEFKNRVGNKKEKKEVKSEEEMTPDEMMESGYIQIKENLKQELIEKIFEINPYLFENIVLKLLVAMGYGNGEVTKRSGDGGFDGVIYRDKLGVGKIYF